MIAFTRFRAAIPSGNPWFAVGPVYTGRAEWRHTIGVSISVGSFACAAYWHPREKPDSDLLDTATGSLAAVGRLLGRLR